MVDCHEHITLDEFADAILVEDDLGASREESPTRTRQDSYFLQSPAFRSISRSPISDSFADTRKIANIIIAKNLDEASKQVQIQALELLRTKRICSRTSVQAAPKRSLFIAVLAGGEGPRLTTHLNNYMFISHFHDIHDGFPNLEELENDADSISSVVRKGDDEDQLRVSIDPMISADDIDMLVKLSHDTVVDVEITRYIRNITAFLRMHRAVHGGISPTATKHFDKLVKALAPLQGLTFVTPSLVALAAKKIYPHRIVITEPQQERSMQWGSELSAVIAALEGVGPEQVIEDVIAMVDVPL